MRVSSVSVLILLLPLGLASLALVWGGQYWAGPVAVAAGMPVWRGWPGRYLGLCLALLAWIWPVWLVLRLGENMLPVWLAIPMAGLVSALPVVLAVRIGRVWGIARADALARAGRPIRESEWVWTGPEFARSHPLAQRLGWIWGIVGIVAAHAVGLAVALWQVDMPGWQTILAAVMLALSSFTLFALVRRHPAAWPLVWLHLISLVPFSAPLMLFWADSPRVNLIYRHRFERLRP